jgi:hypothetical protein
MDLDGSTDRDGYRHAHRDAVPDGDGHSDGFSDIDATLLVGYAHLEQYANA